MTDLEKADAVEAALEMEMKRLEAIGRGETARLLNELLAGNLPLVSAVNIFNAIAST